MQASSELGATEGVGLGEVIEFMRLLWAVDHGLEASSKQMDAQFGITGPQRLVIRIVGRHPGVAAGQIANILHVHPSTLTGVLGRLVERGIVVRKTDPADARRALFSLTTQGRKLDELKTGTIETKVRRALGRVSKREVDGARKVLAALADALATPTKAGANGKTKTETRAPRRRAKAD
jgi:DNA-binding MarR family transcriptional regulator